VSQFARPTSVISAGSWTDQDGSVVAADMISAISEVTADDLTYIQSESDPDDDTVEFSLTEVTDPQSLLTHVQRVRLGKSGSDVIDMTVSLRQGTTEIASWLSADVSATPTTVATNLSTSQINAISDWSDLRMRIVATVIPVVTTDTSQHSLPWLNNA
jgi:hypothetical protein